MKIKFCIILILLFKSYGLHGQNPTEALNLWQKQVQNCRTLYLQDHFEESLKQCELLLPQLAAMTSPDYQLLAADIWSIKGNNLLQSPNREQEALACYQKCLNIRKRHLPPNAMDIAYILRNIGTTYLNTGQPQIAQTYFLKAYKIKQNYPNLNNGAISESLAYACMDMGQMDKAHTMLQRALAEYGPDNPMAVTVIMQLAYEAMQSGRPDSAWSYYRHCDHWLRSDTALSYIDKAMVLKGKAEALQAMGKLAEALPLFLQAYDIVAQYPEENTQATGEILKSLGNGYLQTGDLESAHTFFSRAYLLMPANGYEKWAINLDIGRVLFQKNEFDAALDTFKNIRKYCTGQTNPILQQIAADAAFQLATVYAIRLDWAGAVTEMQRALQFYQQNEQAEKAVKAAGKLAAAFIGLSDWSGAARSLSMGRQAGRMLAPALLFPLWMQYGALAEKTGDRPTARQYYQQAMEAIGATTMLAYVPFPIQKAQVYTAMARVWASESDTVALRFADVAIQTVESAKDQMKDVFTNMGLHHNLSDPYDLAVELCMRLSQYDPQFAKKAFMYAEKSKSQLVRQLAYRAVLSGAPAWALTLDSLENAVNNLQKLHYEARTPDTALQNRLNQSMVALRQYQQKIRNEHPDFYREINTYQSIAVDSIRQHLLRDDQVLLHYHCLDSQYIVFVVTPTAFRAVALGPAALLNQQIETVFKRLSFPPDNVSSLEADALDQVLVDHLGKLYGALIRQLDLPAKQHLLIVPDGHLYLLPFDALIREPAPVASDFQAHQYLAHDHYTQYGSSSAAFWTHPAPRKEPGAGALIVAPDFYKNTSLDTLASNKKEAEWVHGTVGGTVLMGGDAQKTAVLSQIPAKEYIHFATHGIINVTDPRYSYLAFNRLAVASDYERLYLSEIYNMQLPARLVVISACHSGFGAFYKGEGVVSLSHAFRYAGVRDVLASLWTVHDASSPVLMRFFYKNYDDGHHLAKSMALARREFIQTEQIRAHPYYWAGFVGWGTAPEPSGTAWWGYLGRDCWQRRLFTTSSIH